MKRISILAILVIAIGSQVVAMQCLLKKQELTEVAHIVRKLMYDFNMMLENQHETDDELSQGMSAFSLLCGEPSQALLSMEKFRLFCKERESCAVDILSSLNRGDSPVSKIALEKDILNRFHSRVSCVNSVDTYAFLFSESLSRILLLDNFVAICNIERVAFEELVPMQLIDDNVLIIELKKTFNRVVILAQAIINQIVKLTPPPQKPSPSEASGDDSDGLTPQPGQSPSLRANGSYPKK